MTIETDHRAALLAHAPLAALLPNPAQFAVNAVADHNVPTPYVIMTSRITHELGIDNSLLGMDVTLEYQCWADTAVGAWDLSTTLSVAIGLNTEAVVLSSATGYDEEVQRDCIVITAQLLLG